MVMGNNPDNLVFSSITIKEFANRIASVLREELHVSEPVILQLSQRFISEFQENNPASALYNLRKPLFDLGISPKWNWHFDTARAPAIAEWIRPFVCGSVLDLYCGSGTIGRMLSQHGISVQYAEKQKIATFFTKNLLANIRFISDDYFSERKNAFDTVMLIADLHHDSDWDISLKNAVSLARNRLVVIENCINHKDSSELHLLADLFFNHCLNATPLDCPGMHAQAEEWLGRFSVYGQVSVRQYLDRVPGIPVSHDLFVVDLNSHANE